MVTPGKSIKLVVWHLESLRGSQVQALVPPLLSTFDERGILQSLVTRAGSPGPPENFGHAGLAQYFLESRSGPAPLEHLIQEIALALNVRLDRVLLISGESAEVSRALHAQPQIRAVGADALRGLADDPLLGSHLVALESRPRRLVYLEERIRARAEREFPGSPQEFLAGLGMRLDIERAGNADLDRILELVNRPNQLARCYGEEELKALLASSEHACWLVSLRDRFGDCGRVGFLLMELAPQGWTLELALFSCRVARRLVDVIVLIALLRKARAAGVSLRVLFKRSSLNESLWLAYQGAGFVETGRRGDLIVAAHPLETIPPYPCPAELIFHGV